MAAFGARRAAGFLAWRARREARAIARERARPDQPLFRSFVQINLIRLK